MNKGVISFSDDLVITSGYTFEQFRNTRYYKGQNPERVFWLDEKFMFQGHSFMVGLFFRSGVIYMLSLLCCDLEWRKKRRGKNFMTKSCSRGGLYSLSMNGDTLNPCMMPDQI